MRDATLVALARTPLLAPDDLAFLCAIGGRGARRALDARVAAGEAGYVADSATRRHLYFLTAAGVEAAARLMRADPGELTGRYGLGEPALLRRLPALWRLVAGRAILLRLARALADAGGALEEWRAYPVRWPFARGGRREALVLDGEVTLRFADGARCVVGLLWDGDADAPPGALAARLDRLAGARSDPAYAPPYPTRVPPVLLATTSAARVPPGYRPGLLWATTGALAAADPLTVAWRGASGPGGGDEGSPLRAALDRLGRMPPRPTPAATMRVPTTRAAPRRPDALRRRAARVRASPTIEHTPQDLAALPLVLPPRAWPLLHCVGAHPLLGRHDLATVLGRDPFDTWELLRALRAHGLCAAWLPQRSGHAWRYSLTKRGTTLLARAAGLAPSDYRQAYGVLDDARRSGEHGLSYARTNLEHTDGITAAYLVFLAGARARGGRLEWRGEWACTRTYHARDRRGTEHKYTLRPDAELRYNGPGGRFRAFLEYDREQEAPKRFAGKVAQYDAYRAEIGDDGFTVLFVTPRPERGEIALAAARASARPGRRPLLGVRATTATDLAGQGPWAPIWRDAHGAVGPIGAPR
jgi:hypothetical protein